MGYIINRDISMVIYTAAVFTVIFVVHAVAAAASKKAFFYKFYPVCLIVTAVWEYIYSSGTWWRYNNGLFGAYCMIAVPVICVAVCAAVSCIFDEIKKT